MQRSLIGISTAYFLAKSGHQVTVIDRNAALESSFANGAQLSYSHATPWSTFGNILKALKWVTQKDAPLLLRPSLDLDMYKWLLRFVYNALPSKVNENTLKILVIDFYSRKVLHEHLNEFDFDFSYKQSGILHIFDTEQDRKNALKYFNFEIHQHKEVEFKELSLHEVIELEPSLNQSIGHHYTGLLFTKDAIADAYKFCVGLEKKCKEIGVRILYGENIRNLVIDSGKVVAVETE